MLIEHGGDAFVLKGNRVDFQYHSEICKILHIQSGQKHSLLFTEALCLTLGTFHLLL